MTDPLVTQPNVPAVHDDAYSNAQSLATVLGSNYGQRDQTPAVARSMRRTFSLSKALANTATAKTNFFVLGDSNTEGNGSPSLSGRFVSALNNAVRRRYPSAAAGGLGYLPFALSGSTTFALPFTIGGSPTVNNGGGPTRRSVTLYAAGHQITYVAPAGTTSIKLMINGTGGGGVISYTVNGGAATNITDSTVGDGQLTAITLTAGQTLVITQVSGVTILDGIIHYAGDETIGFTAHGGGHFGWNASANTAGWLAPGGSNDWRTAIAALSPTAVFILLGGNDSSLYTAAQFQTNMQALIAYLRGNATVATIPIVLGVPPQPLAAVLDPAGWSAYVAAFRAIAAADATVHVFDLNYRYPAASTDVGVNSYWLADGAHYSASGHPLIGEYIAAGIGPA